MGVEEKGREKSKIPLTKHEKAFDENSVQDVYIKNARGRTVYMIFYQLYF